MKKKMTLAAFKKKHGQTAAAAALGVSTVTLWRWLTKQTRPQGNDAGRLVELGVTVPS